MGVCSHVLPTKAQPLSDVFLPFVAHNTSGDPELPVWSEKYYPNPNTEGLPAARRRLCYAYPALDWGTSAPSAALPADGFSVRVAAFVEFAEGDYAFYLSADDSCRLLIDGRLVIDQWGPGSQGLATYRYSEQMIVGGTKHIEVDYADREGDARVRCFWIRTDLYPAWHAEYWSNPNLQDAPSLVRNEAAIAWNWGSGSPATGIPSDGFSARWTRAVLLREGQHVFQAQADDGFRMWVDEWSPGREVIATWNAASPTFRSGARYLTADAAEGDWHIITVEYRDVAGPAACHYTQHFGGAADTYLAEYYHDAALTDLARIQNDDQISFPRPEVTFPPANVAGSGGVFSVRWTRALYLPTGTHTWSAEINTGGNLWIDDQLVLTTQGGCTEPPCTGSVYLETGWHVLRMEYHYAGSGEARARLSKQ
ncbi:MAG: PA14 domain-containing protein [Anaerolineae bacterium]